MSEFSAYIIFFLEASLDIVVKNTPYEAVLISCQIFFF